MPNKIYTSKYYGAAGNPTVYEQSNVSIKKIGNDIPASMETVNVTNPAYPRALNRVATFESEKYVIQDNDVYKLSASGTWDLDFNSTASQPDTDQFAAVGLFPVLIGAEPYLYFIRKGAGNNNVMTRKSSPIKAGGTWDTETVFAGSVWTSTLPGDVSFSVILDNVVYFKHMSYLNNASYTYAANLATQNISVYPYDALPPERNVNANNLCSAGDMTTWNGKIYYTMHTTIDNFGQRIKENYLYEVHGSVGPRKVLQINTFQDKSDVRVGLSGPSNTQHRDALFEKSGNLYAIVYATGWEQQGGATLGIDTVGSTGWAMYKIAQSGDSIVVDNEITDTVLPLELRRTAIESGSPNAASWLGRWTKTHQVDESGSERVYLYYSNSALAGSLVTLYEFVDDTQELIEIDTGLDASLSNASYRQGGGNYEVKPVEAFIGDVREGTNAGTVDIDVTIVGTGQPLLLGMLFNEDKDVATTVMNLLATTSGTVISGNTAVSGLLASDTGNMLTLTWDAEAQGITFGVQTTMNPILTLL